MDSLTQILEKLEYCVKSKTYESLEAEWLEIKPVPATGNAWDNIRESVCAFLNTQGGVVVLGVKEEQHPHRHFTFTGYTESNSGMVSDLRSAFKDVKGNPKDVSDSLLIQIRQFATGQIALVRVSALPEEQKFCFYREVAFERIADGDRKISKQRVDAQEERKQEMETYRELHSVEGVGLDDLSIQRINELILLINQGQAQPIETIKSTHKDAVPFLERKRFMLRDGKITTLGVLVCCSRPEDQLLFKSQMDVFVDVPNTIAQDKKTFKDNILQLMEAGHGWTLRNIMTGVSSKAGGTQVAEYPENLIRECINNALAHRDYSINRPVQLTIKPRISLTIRNPGRLPHELVFEKPNDLIPIRRIFANPRARNPRLADVLKLHNKWEGKGIGMSEMVNYALANQIDVPHYLFHPADEISLIIPSGKVLDEDMESWLDLRDGFIASKTGNNLLTNEHRMVLAYLLKSERLNQKGLYTLALTPSNNHFGAIGTLKNYGLISLHSASDQLKEIYMVSRELSTDDVTGELRQVFGKDFDDLDVLGQQTLNLIRLAEKFSRSGGLNAKQVGRHLKSRLPDEFLSRGEDEIYRAVRYRVARMAPDKKSLELDTEEEKWHSAEDKMLSIRGPSRRPLFRINPNYRKSFL